MKIFMIVLIINLSLAGDIDLDWNQGTSFSTVRRLIGNNNSFIQETKAANSDLKHVEISLN